MSGQPWNRVPRTGSTMEVDPSQPRAQVTLDLAALPPPLSQNGETVRKKRRRESSEDTIGERNPTQDHRWQGPSRPPSVASGHGSNATDEMHRLAITGPVASGEYYESWPDPDPESEDEPGRTQPAQDPPTPTQAELTMDSNGQVGTLHTQVFRRQLTKEDTLMSIDLSQPQGASTSTATLEEQFAAMFDQMRQKQRDDLELFAENIRVQLVVECADLKNEMTRLRAELVDLRLQYQRMQNAR
ncbi:hypothetical protein LXA43DRAFT_584166 [Ganoderma leucocontextum]|nr:hypothetical protein LXA43DRAFT_584166 [Ganoderma leucocontextum]